MGAGDNGIWRLPAASFAQFLRGDDTVWIDVNDKDFDFVRLIVDAGRRAGFEPITHVQALEMRDLWASGPSL